MSHRGKSTDRWLSDPPDPRRRRAEPPAPAVQKPPPPADRQTHWRALGATSPALRELVRRARQRAPTRTAPSPALSERKVTSLSRRPGAAARQRVVAL